jgi:hypothetical protein
VALVLRFVFWPMAFIAPAGGPGFVKEGGADDITINDYAERWYTERWSWRVKTYKLTQERVLLSTHPRSRETVKAEMERDARLVRELNLSMQTVVLEAKILKRTGSMVTVAVKALRTITIGGKEEPEELVEGKLLVVPWTKNGLPYGLVAIPAPTPALTPPAM